MERGQKKTKIEGQDWREGNGKDKSGIQEEKRWVHREALTDSPISVCMAFANLSDSICLPKPSSVLAVNRVSILNRLRRNQINVQ